MLAAQNGVSVDELLRSLVRERAYNPETGRQCWAYREVK